MKTWKVGALAKQTGLSVRTLHYYEEIGLLKPSARGDSSGHRLYSEDDVRRLQQIQSLKQLGLPLEQIDSCLKGYSTLQVIQMHLKRVEADRERLARLHSQLVAVERALLKNENASIEDVIRLMEVMSVYDKYFSKEQMDQLAERRKELGEDKIKTTEAEWPRLMASVKAEMEAGTPPDHPRAQELAQRWDDLVKEFTGGDAKLHLSLRNMYKNEPAMRQNAGMDDRLHKYVEEMMFFLARSKM